MDMIAKPSTQQNSALFAHILLITGMSGSGKTVAISCLEDAGYYCVDNFPPNLLRALIHETQNAGITRLAVAVDIRSGSLQSLPQIIENLKNQQPLDILFLNASDEILLQRFSETRRKHPFSHNGFEEHAQDLLSCLQQERLYLQALRDISHVIDTSMLKKDSLWQTLQEWIDQRQDFKVSRGALLTLQSFGFKYGLPRDCDFVFDVRHLPNPFYEEILRPMTGLDEPVKQYFQEKPHVLKHIQTIAQFLQSYLTDVYQSQRAYITIGIGCTGGQHRSVYVVESLAEHFKHMPLIKRHRCL